jgi:transcriptional regulator with XRE-family HTH domain
VVAFSFVMKSIDLSPNQVVAFNLKRLRDERDWSADKTRDELGKLLGRPISLASYSAMERSIDSDRIKRFDADEIFAIARAFGVPIWVLFDPPINYKLQPVRIRLRDAARDTSVSRMAALPLIAPTTNLRDTASAVSRIIAGKQMDSTKKLDPNDPLDRLVLEAVNKLFLTPSPLPTSAPEQQKQQEEMLAFLQELASRYEKESMPKRSRKK